MCPRTAQNNVRSVLVVDKNALFRTRANFATTEQNHNRSTKHVRPIQPLRSITSMNRSTLCYVNAQQTEAAGDAAGLLRRRGNVDGTNAYKDVCLDHIPQWLEGTPVNFAEP